MNKLLIVGTVAFDSIKTPFGKVNKILGGSGMYIGISSSVFNIDNSLEVEKHFFGKVFIIMI
jgi:hypothetical protein